MRDRPLCKLGRKGEERSRGRRRVAHGDAGDLHVAKVGDVDRAALLVCEGALELACGRGVIVVVDDLQPSTTFEHMLMKKRSAVFVLSMLCNGEATSVFPEHWSMSDSINHSAMHIQADKVRLV